MRVTRWSEINDPDPSPRNVDCTSASVYRGLRTDNCGCELQPFHPLCVLSTHYPIRVVGKFGCLADSRDRVCLLPFNCAEPSLLVASRAAMACPLSSVHSSPVVLDSPLPLSTQFCLFFPPSSPPLHSLCRALLSTCPLSHSVPFPHPPHPPTQCPPSAGLPALRVAVRSPKLLNRGRLRMRRAMWERTSQRKTRKTT